MALELPPCGHWSGKRGQPEPTLCGLPAPFVQRDRPYIWDSYMDRCARHLNQERSYWVRGLDPLPQEDRRGIYRPPSMQRRSLRAHL